MEYQTESHNYGTISRDNAARHTNQTVDEDERMRLNGESKEQMAHAHAIKAAGGVSLNKSDGDDTSKDQQWEYDDSRGALATDHFVLASTMVWMFPKIVVFGLPMWLFHIPPFIVCRLYISSLPDGTERLHRSWYFYLCFTIALVLGLPAGALAILSLALDYIVYYIFCLLFCLFTWRWSKVMANMEKIRPYRNGPSNFLVMPDFFAAVCGQCGRQTLGETMYMVSVMWLIMPWLKYYICCNPWMYDLDHRLCQQISTQMKDLGSPDEVADTARAIISRARQRRSLAERLDLWSFVPHYPYPPPNRRWAIGLQAGGAAYPGKFTLIVNTTHAASSAGGSTEQFVLSNSCERPIYRVMLWYSNPYHFLTGWVEASVSNGRPSQPHKDGGGEHPMWLVTGHTPLVSGRESFTGSGMIDGFFDYWLPVFVHEMRRFTFFIKYQNDPDGPEKALKYADDHYEEVVSKDGVSAPTGLIGRQHYKTHDALSEFETMGAKQNKERYQGYGRRMGNCAESDCGMNIAALQQGRDLHAPADKV